MTKPWIVLSKLAERRLQDSQKQLQAIDQALANLSDREGRFEQLIQENLARLNNPQGRVMADLQVIGGFIRNLSFVVAGIKEERSRLLVKRTQALIAYDRSKKELQKMESLQEREVEKAQELSKRREIREMDALGIQRHNLR